MGQRFQIIISTPNEYWNDSNPNNKDRQYHVYHCQWLYGATATVFAERLCKAISKAISGVKENKQQHDFPVVTRDYLDISMQYSAHSFFPNNLRISNYYDGEGCLKYIQQYSSWKDLVYSLDNNNGVLIIWIDDKFNVQYCFYNRTDAEDERGTLRDKALSAKEYLLGYYTLDDCLTMHPNPLKSLRFFDSRNSLFFDIDKKPFPIKKRKKSKGVEE